VSDEPGDETDDTSAPAHTLRDALRGATGDPVAKAHMDKLLGDLRDSVGMKSALAGLGKLPTGIGRPPPGMEAVTARAVQQQRDEASWLEQQRIEWTRMADFKERERQAELEWRAGLLEQQRLTVEAITSLNAAQVSDRRINVWVLRVTAATLVVSIIAVLVAIILA
jgi:hypothetical protein